MLGRRCRTSRARDTSYVAERPWPRSAPSPRKSSGPSPKSTRPNRQSSRPNQRSSPPRRWWSASRSRPPGAIPSDGVVTAALTVARLRSRRAAAAPVAIPSAADQPAGDKATPSRACARAHACNPAGALSALGPRSADPPAPRRRSSWTALTGGALLVAAALLPDYVDGVNLFDHDDFRGLVLTWSWVRSPAVACGDGVAVLRSGRSGRTGGRGGSSRSAWRAWPRSGSWSAEWRHPRARSDGQRGHLGRRSAGGLTTVAAGGRRAGRPVAPPQDPVGAEPAPRPDRHRRPPWVGPQWVAASTTMAPGHLRGAVRATARRRWTDQELAWAWAVPPECVGLVAGILLLRLAPDQPSRR